jgi:hypothetical protein
VLSVVSGTCAPATVFETLDRSERRVLLRRVLDRFVEDLLLVDEVETGLLLLLRREESRVDDIVQSIGQRVEYAWDVRASEVGLALAMGRLCLFVCLVVCLFVCLFGRDDDVVCLVAWCLCWCFTNRSRL